MRGKLIDYLLADAGVAALVGPRIRPGFLAQGEGTPALVVNKISGAPMVTMGGPAGLAEARMQVDCYAATWLQAEALADAVKAALSAIRFTHDGMRFEGSFAIDERDLSESDGPDGVRRPRISLDFRIFHEE